MKTDQLARSPQLAQTTVVFMEEMQKCVVARLLAKAGVREFGKCFRQLFFDMAWPRIDVARANIAVYRLVDPSGVNPLSLGMDEYAIHPIHFLTLLATPFEKDKSPFLMQGEANAAIIDHPFGPRVIVARRVITRVVSGKEPDEGYWSANAGLYIDRRRLFGENTRIFVLAI